MSETRLTVAGRAFVRGFGRGDPRREAIAAAVLLDRRAMLRSNRELGALAGVSASTAFRWKLAARAALERARRIDGLAKTELLSG